MLSEEEPPLTRRERLRRAGILCTHCLTNVAYHRALVSAGVTNHVDTIVANNFLDMAVIEWCKLFGTERGKPSEQHAWHRIVTDPDLFNARLLGRLRYRAHDFARMRKDIREYRDQFVAHLDSARRMGIPELSAISVSAAFYYDYLLEKEDTNGTTYPDAVRGGEKFYKERLAEGEEHFRRRVRGLNDPP